jgi:hypothetical protein
VRALIAAAVLAVPWSFDGFVRDPEHGGTPPAVALPQSKRPAQPEAAARPRINPASKDGVSPAKSQARSPSGAAAPVSGPAVPKAPVAVTETALYQLADESGKVWEHPNPVWLRRWVESRNASLATSRPVFRYEVPLLPSASSLWPAAPSCTSGRCFRQP